MRSKVLVLVIAIAHATQVLVLSKAEESKRNLHKALEDSGGNRIELESALRKVKGMDTEYLICHASQYDLVNPDCRADHRKRHLRPESPR